MEKSFLNDGDIVLRPLNKSDIGGNYSNWFNDSDVIGGNSHGRFPMTFSKLEAYIEKADSSENLIVFAVVLNSTKEHVGNISLQNINWVDRSAEIAFILGETKYHGKGIMYIAGLLLIRHAFKELNLHRVYCGTLETNLGMIKLAEKIGMSEEGRRRQAIFKKGCYLDILEYGLIANEWGHS